MAPSHWPRRGDELRNAGRTGTDRYRRRAVRAEAELDMQRSRSAQVL